MKPTPLPGSRTILAFLLVIAVFLVILNVLVFRSEVGHEFALPMLVIDGR